MVHRCGCVLPDRLAGRDGNINFQERKDEVMDLTVGEVMEKYHKEHKAAIVHNGQLIGFVDEETEGECEDDQM